MKLLDLPLEVFRHVTDYAVPKEASDLNSDSLRAHTSTTHLQLVNKAFYREVTTQLFQERPLQIRVFDSTLLHHLTSGRILDFSKIQQDLRHLGNVYESLPLHRLTAVPLCRFRRINIHLIPLLAPVNDDSGLELHYFEPSWPDQRAPNLTEHYKETLYLQSNDILEQARALSNALQEGIRSTHSAISLRCTSFKLYFHENPMDIIPSYLLPTTAYSIPRAPIKQLAFTPCARGSAQNATPLFPTSPALPMWSPDDVLCIMHCFIFISRRNDDHSDIPGYPTFDDSIQLPRTLACLYHDTAKSTAWHHNYWRQRFRHCFSNFDDMDRNIGLGADCLKTWYFGRTMVRRKAWSTPPYTTRELPRLVLQDLDSPILEELGYICLGGFACCVSPELSGCQT